MESRLHSASFCRQHGHRAPFRPHGQRTVCHPTGNTALLRSSLLTQCSSFVHASGGTQDASIAECCSISFCAHKGKAPGWFYLEEHSLCPLLSSSHSSLFTSVPFFFSLIFHTSASLLTAISSPSPLSLMPSLRLIIFSQSWSRPTVLIRDDHTDPPQPFLPDPFILLQSVMYLWYSVCCTACSPV